MNNSRDRLLRYSSTALLGLCLLQIAAWLPGYLTRPLFADHDVFATMARAWDAGVLPYRDLISNNFPGTIYLFWCLGKTCGWDCVPAFYAADAALLIALVAMSLGWSRARFGRILPGTIGALALTSYYCNLDFSQSAQRDWHAASLVALALMAAQTWPGRAVGVLSALLFSAGMLVRPQVILVLPAMLLAVTEGRRLSGGSRISTIKVATAWLAVVALGLLLGFLPLVLEGLMGDFLEGLRAVAYGGAYNKKSFGTFARMILGGISTYRISAVIVCLIVLTRAAWTAPSRALATAWLAALTGVFFYAPLSPGMQIYLYHPLWLIWSIGLAVLVGQVLEADVPPKGFLYLALAIDFAGISWPLYSRPEPSQFASTVAALAKGREVGAEPPGYQNPYGDWLVIPPWEDYRDVLHYLRTRTSPGTRVANLLKGVAITAPTARLSALPAESATWVFVVKPDDELKFAQALEKCPDSVVVMWAPGEIGKYDHPLPKIEEVVRRHYVPDAQFGSLAIWRRRTKD